MARVILVQPVYSIDFEHITNIQLPLGLLSIATSLQKSGHVVEIFDLQKVAFNEKIKSVTVLADRLIKRIEEFMPDAMGISCMSISYLFVAKLLSIVKSKWPALTTFLGGPQPTLTARETLETMLYVDYVLSGEGEYAILFFADFIDGKIGKENVPNLSYRLDEKIITNEALPLIKNLDELPFINFSLLSDFDSYFSVNGKKIVSVPIEAGRGCPYSCTFCSTSIVWQRKFRLKTIDRLIEETKWVLSQTGGSMVTFIHDNMAVNKEWIVAFALSFHESFPDVVWGLSTRIDNIDADTLATLSACKCKGIYFGIETGSPRIQQLIKKRLNLDVVYDVFKICKILGIECTFSFIVGYPFETRSDLEQTFLKVFKLRSMGAMNVQIHYLVPEAGTELTKEYYNDLNLPEYTDEWMQELLFTDSQSDVEMIRNHKSIFSSCYEFATKSYDNCLLRKIQTLARILLYLYPKTTLILAEHLKLSPLHMVEIILKHMPDPISEASVMINMEHLIEMILDESQNSDVEVVFRYEDFRAALKSSVDKYRVYNSRLFVDHIAIFKADSHLSEFISSGVCENVVPSGHELNVVTIVSGDRSYLKTYVGVSSLKFEIIKYICDGCVNYDEIATHLVDQYHIENQEAFIKEYYSHCLISLAKQKILEEDPVNEYIGHLK